jgi:hypothetical protein
MDLGVVGNVLVANSGNTPGTVAVRTPTFDGPITGCFRNVTSRVEKLVRKGTERSGPTSRL